ncbi:cupin domain-containing protein [Salinibacterium sp. UTAS2018]|uniref:cupin domain-containing protein n=1 Tax=Salinibacterium sp. UTAS2018 TaxID=2508880 RepID=UPI0010094161|nr:cupin domain-containing protein [Salinibacterium sp. UTAS2018]QAV70990.1 cupin domain-containing protein [Salinibacterium sp. UTAS2018]
MNTEQNFTLGNNVEHFTIGELAQQSPDFRRVLWTGKHSQIVIMTIPAGGDIGEEIHENSDQILTFISGTGAADLAGHTHPIEGGDQCAVPAGTKHNFRNTGDQPLVLYTVYSPPEHAVDAVHATKQEGDIAEESGHDKPPAR